MRIRPSESAPEFAAALFAGLDDGWPRFFSDSRPDFSTAVWRRLGGPGATSHHYQLQLNDHRRPHYFFVKHYLPDNPAAPAPGLESAAGGAARAVHNDYLLADWLADKLGGGAALAVEKPYLHLAQAALVVSPFVFGRNLAPLFYAALRWPLLARRDYPRLAALVARIGSGLVELQALDIGSLRNGGATAAPVGTVTMANRTIADKTRHELGAFADFFAAQPTDRGLVNAAIDVVRQQVQTLESTPPRHCFQHNDFILRNLLISRHGRLHLFDFPEAGVGLPAFDIAHFINSLEDLTYLKSVSRQQVAGLIETFLAPLRVAPGFDPQAVTAMRLFIQLYSTKIILSSRQQTESRSLVGSLLRWWLFCDPVKRFNHNVTALLKEVDR